MTDSLLPPNATGAERALEAATARVGAIPVDYRPRWNPDTCPADELPWLAWALSVDTWNANWPEAVKRAQIRASIALHRRKGTVAAVADAVAAFGGAIEIVEWFRMEPPGAPFTFDLTLTVAELADGPPSADYIDDIVAQVGRVKNARSHFTFTQGLQAAGGLGLVAALRSATFTRLQLNA